MNKKILMEYIDACELIKETEADIKRLEKRKKVISSDKVKGSMKEFPYVEKSFQIEGTEYTYQDDRMLRQEEMLLKERKAKAYELKLQVDKFMNLVPVRIQRIIKYKYFEELSWEQVANKLGRKATAESVRKELERFFAEK